VAAIPTYLLSKFAREHVTVALTGEGADELFAGYDHYRLESLMPYLKWTPTLWRAAERAVRPVASPRIRKALRAASMDQTERFVYVRSVIPTSARRDLLRADVRAEIPRGHLVARMEQHFTGGDELNAVLRADALEWLPDDLLMKVDKMSMLASLKRVVRSSTTASWSSCRISGAGSTATAGARCC
jgi:asparagine synthase (glutamine-hydrolysing)